MQEEIWVPVQEWEEFYEISNKGRLRSLDREYIVFDKRWETTYKTKTKGRILKPSYGKESRGYPKYVLTRGSLYPKVDVQAHRLVAQHFVPNPENKTVVNHKDHNKRNACADNLEWVTQKENVLSAKEAGVLKAKNKESRKYTHDQIIWMKSLYYSKAYTDRDIAEIFNTGLAHIRRLCEISDIPERKCARLKWCYPQTVASIIPQVFKRQNNEVFSL